MGNEWHLNDPWDSDIVAPAMQDCIIGRKEIGDLEEVYRLECNNPKSTDLGATAHIRSILGGQNPLCEFGISLWNNVKQKKDNKGYNGFTLSNYCILPQLKRQP